MKQTWLYTALCAWLIAIVHELAWPLCLFSVLFLYRKQKKWCCCSMAIFLLLISRTASHIQEPPAQTFVAEITEIKSSYALAKTSTQTVVLYGVEAYGFGDVLEVTGTCNVLSGNRNFHQFDFSAYMNKRSIYYGCDAAQVTLQKQGSGLRSDIWHNISRREKDEQAWLKLSLYGIKEQQEIQTDQTQTIKEEEQELSYMASSSGMHLSFLAQGLTSLFLLWLSPSLAGVCSLVVITGIGVMTTFRDSLLRIVCFRLCSLLVPSLSTHDQLGIGMLLVLLLRPYLANELTFVLPVMFRLIYLFMVQKKSKHMISFLVLIPLQFYYFNEVDLIQILLFPVLRIVYAITYLLALCALLVPFGIWLIISGWLFHMARWIGQFSIPFYFHASLLFVCIWYLTCFHFISRHDQRDRVLLLALLLYTQTSTYLQPYMEVMMIDVGQGDCTLITLPFHQGTILIDVAGHKKRDLAEEIIVPVLHAKGITSLDLVIITHDDYDHSGGLASLQELIEVKQVITQKQENVAFGNFHFQFLLQDQAFSDINENSIITYLEAYGTKLLFMGDAGKPAEQALLKEYPSLQADVLKVGHHGSHSSSSKPFIHQIHPSLGLISCGANNFYGHPSPITIDTLQQEQVRILDTSKNGAVSIKFTNILRFYKTATSEFGIIDIGD